MSLTAKSGKSTSNIMEDNLPVSETTPDVTPVTPVENAPTVEATETQAPQASTTDTETAPVETTSQPEDNSEERPKRSDKRIKQLTQDRDYWKTIAEATAQQQPATPADPTDDNGGLLTAEEIAAATIKQFNQSQKLDKAREAMLDDAALAEEQYPELATNEKLAKRVVVIAQTEGISILDAARDLIDGPKTAAKKAEARANASEAARAASASPSANQAGTTESRSVKWADLSETERRDLWPDISAGRIKLL